MSKEELDILKDIKTHFEIRPVFKISFEELPANYKKSKIGGSFYWREETLPNLKFLAQINFEELPINDIFPKKGLLQFFIKDDDCYGLFDKGKNNILVIYQEDLDIGRAVIQDYDEDFPIKREVKMSFILDKESISYSDYRFNDYLFDNKYELSDRDYELFDGSGSKLLGYPFFCQEDPRYNEEYDILLFQLDTIYPYIRWGDNGLCNFFINRTALSKLDFSDILYNWDCY